MIDVGTRDGEFGLDDNNKLGLAIMLLEELWHSSNAKATRRSISVVAFCVVAKCMTVL